MKAQFNQSSISRMLAQKVERLQQAVLSRLIYIGETCISLARENGQYNDITGNLRSSVGYLILQDGQVVQENFQEAERGSDKFTGRNKGRFLAEQLGQEHPSGYVLIVVAGMEYAAQVESRGKDVLTSSAMEAERLLKEAIAIIGGKVRA